MNAEVKNASRVNVPCGGPLSSPCPPPYHTPHARAEPKKGGSTLMALVAFAIIDALSSSYNNII
jgi:hypothetical protein